MMPKPSTFLAAAAILCLGDLACSQTDIKHAGPARSTAVPDDVDSTPGAGKEQCDEHTMTLLEFLQLITGGVVPIESLSEVPVAWETPVQEMVEFFGKYAVDSLDEFRLRHADIIINDRPDYVEAFDSAQGLYITVSVTSMDNVPIMLELKEQDGDTGEGFSAMVSIYKESRNICDIHQDGRWPGFHIVEFHPNGEVFRFSYSPTPDLKAIIAQFDEDGQLNECYAICLVTEAPVLFPGPQF